MGAGAGFSPPGTPAGSGGSNAPANPFEAMTTVTVKIVSQLTGDTEFASPETLVAFALGIANIFHFHWIILFSVILL